MALDTGELADAASPDATDGPPYCSVGCRDADNTLSSLPKRAGQTKPLSEPAVDLSPAQSHADGSDEGREQAFFHVAGMHCATCEAFLETQACKVAGVSEASASYVSESVRVTYDPAETDREEVADALSVAGYRVADREDTGTESVATVLSREGDTATRDLEDLLGYQYAAGVLFGLFLMFPYVVVLYPYHLSDLLDGPLSGFDGGVMESGLILLLPLFAIVTGVVVFFTGLPLLRGAYVSLRMRRPNTDLLATLTLLTAYVYSIVALLVGRVDIYFDLTILVAASVVAAVFYESLAKQRAMDRLTDLTISQTDEARVTESGETETRSVADLEPGDQVLVGQGERVPVDGTLVEGTCTVDESVVTGESLPVRKEAGDSLVGGSIVTDGAPVIRVGDPPTSSIDRLTTAVWLLQSATHGLQRGTDRLASIVVPVLVAGAVAVGVGAVLTGTSPVVGLLWGFGVVLVACPWTLALSTPLSVATSIRAAMERGIVVFDETVFERIRETDVVVFDKTGTLTHGRMTVESADAPPAVLDAVAAIERRAAHPAAAAITDAFGESATDTSGGEDERTTTDGGHSAAFDDTDPETPAVTGFESYSLGVGGTVDGSEYLVGHPALFDQQGWTVGTDVRERVTAVRESGDLPVVVGRDGEASGVVVLADEQREGWDEVLSRLGERETDVVVLTGDDAEATGYLRDHPHVTHVFAGVPPEGKTETVRRLQAESAVTMVGDGTNDAPALACADLGISLGGGTALASDAADIAIADDDLGAVETTFDLARVAGRRLTQNTALALGYNAILVPAALLGLLNPFVAVAAATLSGTALAVNAHRRFLPA
jgi:heavy metal translocating P-type ATPase